MEVDAATATVLAAGSCVVALIALALAGVALRGQRRVREAYRAFSGDGRTDRTSEDVLTLIKRHLDAVGELRADVGRQARYAEGLRTLIAGCVSRMGTVRYDAFDDMGGRLSFSIALLDEQGDGAVLTAINGRAETRAYAKPVTGGHSRHNLSKEESLAITQAMEPDPPRGSRRVKAPGRGRVESAGGDRAEQAGGQSFDDLAEKARR